ncbi:hypothetical protein [Leeuwenhoekiella marinoflava]|uniref:Uncharacterized protein n=2 Tax=Leeuwenhoekiella marinoflava TaxID=988 RepID=A0A4Q0PPD2_9FLAO|nr:hypothetical protein [Leeuwenhoekiella marinoflava]RXG32012.1 hypothetical protein DSL99_1315 [Leeuwenhoekiella marinoflava]SHE94948.1 hypothetical protein SAMN02745246_01372 [Leeuwenhoekiella marinoflava DSM 3653]
MAKTIERIDQFRQHKGISLNAFDASIGRPSGYTGKQIRSSGSVGSDILETILRTYEEINPGWLISGEGEMLKNESDLVKEEQEPYPKPEINQSTALIRKDIQQLSEGLAQPLERLSDGVLKLLIDQQKILRVTEGLNINRLNKIGDKLDQLLKEL